MNALGRLSGILVLAMAAWAVAAGCDSKEEEGKGGKHEHKAPHKGALVEFGEEYAHMELVIDSATGQVTGYVLDGEAEKPVRISQKDIAIDVKKPKVFTLMLKAAANSLTGETVGDSSQFDGQAADLKGLKEFDAVVAKIAVKGKQFSNVEFNFPKGNETK